MRFTQTPELAIRAYELVAEEHRAAGEAALATRAMRRAEQLKLIARFIA
jgi:hypothetical protein